MITPIEIQNKTFKSGGLGYDKKDVDNFLREVLNSYETVYRENMEYRDKVTVLNEGLQYYKTIEKALQKALILAEKTSEDTKTAALKVAKSIEKEATAKAQLIVADAKNELEHIHSQTIRLLQQYERYKVQYKSLATSQVELLESDSFQINIARLDAFIGKDKQEESTPVSESFQEHQGVVQQESFRDKQEEQQNSSYYEDEELRVMLAEVSSASETNFNYNTNKTADVNSNENSFTTDLYEEEEFNFLDLDEE